MGSSNEQKSAVHLFHYVHYSTREINQLLLPLVPACFLYFPELVELVERKLILKYIIKCSFTQRPTYYSTSFASWVDSA